MKKKTRLPVYSITEDNYQYLRDSTCGGICLACGEIHEDGVEPDAEGYDCDYCGAPDVCGVEQALLLGRLTIRENG